MSDPVLGGLIGAVVGVAASPAVAILCDRLPERASLRPPWTLGFQPVSGLLTILACVSVGIRIGPHADLAAFLYVAVIGAALAVIDMRCKRLPNALTYPSYPLVLALLALGLAGVADGSDARDSVVGGAIFFGVFLLLWLARPNDLGLGDVKLSGILGLVLGWLGWGSWFVGLASGFLIGGVWSIGLLVSRRASMKTRIPYGPFMLSGALVGVLWGASWASSYLGVTVN